ncbi:MAG: hypothetical protein JWQ02_168 [Capsulimonas sp.]|nr:hypothetical protein [Capsulimonas sp.]
MKHGLYSKIERPRIKELLEAADELEDPLDLLPHVKMLGALVTDWIDRYDTFTEALIAWHQSYENPEHASKPKQLLDITAAAGLIGQVGEMVDRIHKHREKGSISMATMNSLMEAQNLAFMQAVQEKIPDADLRAKVIEDADRRIGEIRIDTNGRPA